MYVEKIKDKKSSRSKRERWRKHPSNTTNSSQSDCTNIKLSFWKLIHPRKFMLVHFRLLFDTIGSSRAAHYGIFLHIPTLFGVFVRSSERTCKTFIDFEYISLSLLSSSTQFTLKRHCCCHDDVTIALNWKCWNDWFTCSHTPARNCRKSSLFKQQKARAEFSRLLNAQQCRQLLKCSNYLHIKFKGKLWLELQEYVPTLAHFHLIHHHHHLSTLKSH